MADAAAALRAAAAARLDATAALVREQAAAIPQDDADACGLLADATAQLETARAALATLDEDGADVGERLRRGVLAPWVKAHLDATFAAEQVVADGQRAIAPEELANLLALVRAPVDAAAAWAADAAAAAEPLRDPVQMGALLAALFDTEVAETVLWRLGALHFMFASSRCNMADTDAVPDCPPQVYWDGVRFLRAMLTVRPGFQYPQADAGNSSKPQLLTNLAPADRDPTALVGDGVYGTVTVLAVMYSIELLGWLDRAWGRGGADALGVDREHVRLVGLGLLHHYFSLLRTTLAGMGWSYDRALAVWHQLDPESFARDSAAVTKSLAESSRRLPFFFAQ